MITLKKFMENNSIDKTVVFAFGRFQPPTIGHQLLVQKVMSVANKEKADHVIVLSKTHDKKNNPLSPERKLFWFKKIFKNANVKISDENTKTFIECMKNFNGSYSNVILVCGSDRKEEFEKTLDKYNGDLYNFKKIEVLSCGARDFDSDTSMSSGTLVRKAASENNFDIVRKNVPNLSDLEIKSLMDDLTEYQTSSKRESYIDGEYLKLNDIVSDGVTTFKILKTGTNYLTLVNESAEVEVKWITDIKKSRAMGKKFETNKENLKYNGYQTNHIRSFNGLTESLLEVIDNNDSKYPLDTLNLIKMSDRFCEVLKKIPEKLSEDELQVLTLVEKYSQKLGFEYFNEIINEIKDTHDLIKSKLTGAEFLKQLNDLEDEDERINKKKIGKGLIDADDNVTKQHVRQKYVDEEISDDEFSEIDFDKLVDDLSDDDLLDVYDPTDFAFVDDEGNFIDELDDGKEEVNEVLSRQGRLQAKARFRRSQSKRLRNAKIALKRRSSSENLQKKARRLAVNIMKRKLAKKDINKLSISEKERLERIIARRGKVITRMTGRLVSKIKKIETNRLSHKKFTK